MAIRVDGQYVEARHISGKSCHEQSPARKFTRDEILANLLGQLNISSSWHCFLALTIDSATVLSYNIPKWDILRQPLHAVIS
jgi:hypothetical protein